MTNWRRLRILTIVNPDCFRVTYPGEDGLEGCTDAGFRG